jgi:site-specific DNA-methyltransferase (cytosine-N4-specific)
VDCVVTSPPYWGLRDYGTGHWVDGDPSCVHRRADHDGRAGQQCRRCGARREDEQHGLEPTPRD